MRLGEAGVCNQFFHDERSISSDLRLAPRRRRVRLHHPQSPQPDHDGRLTRLTRVVETVGGRHGPEVRRVSQPFQEREVKVFMLANRLPCSRAEPADVQSAVPAFCLPDGADIANRLFQETELMTLKTSPAMGGAR